MFNIGLETLVTSIDCERGISMYNSIKTEHRCNLSIDHTDTLMSINMDGQKADEKFDFDAAFENWMFAKVHRGYKNIMFSAASVFEKSKTDDKDVVVNEK